MIKKLRKNEKGITIIALVITIIVLLILAGISIATITGDNGIINKSDEAKIETEISQYKEKLEVIKHGEYADDYTVNLDKFLDKYADAVKKDKMFQEAKEVTADHTNKVVIVVTKEGYRFEVTLEDTTYVGNENGGENTEVDISKVRITITSSPENWTNGKVKVKITSNITKVSKEYSTDGGKSWKKYENEIEVQDNGTEIQARGVNEKNEKTEVVKKRIENIDRQAPNTFAPTVKGIKNKLEIKANTTDKEATTEDGKSGIKGYKFSKDNGSTWTGLKTEGSYIYENLQPGTTYPIKVKAIDNAGNEIETNTTNGTTEEEITIPDGEGKINFTKIPNGWTRGTVRVEIGTKEQGYGIEYSTDGSSYTSYNAPVEVRENKTIYARLTDGTNYGTTATGNVSNIDRILPTGTGTVSMESEGAKEATIKITATDRESGIASITNKTTNFIRKENDTTYKITKNGTFEFNVTDKAGNTNTITVKVEEFLWEETTTSDSEWYSYNDVSNGDRKAKANAPVLKGNMKPIKYVGPESDTQGGSKWANAMTTDGSMWVWIPRYAYKITEGYHTNQAGTIEIAFLDTTNHFLNGETGEITMNPEEQGAGQTKWLVHPAFTSNAEYGGGFGEISGMWVGKFETTGEYTEGNASKVSVKPAIKNLRKMTINDQYKAGMKATYEENSNLNSHMMKNSEWGVTVYLAHSKYGTNKRKIEQNKSSNYTGGATVEKEIYTTNKKQSTTYNATGVFDLNGGATERIASYINNGHENLKRYGGTNVGDIYGATREEEAISTKYKTVYSSRNYEYDDYETAGRKNKGDAVYETSASNYDVVAWFNSWANFPDGANPFFSKGMYFGDPDAGSFAYAQSGGSEYSEESFRLVLVP